MNRISPNTTEAATKMPALFVGHGSPLNAIEDNEFSRAWAEVGRSLPAPSAILCISAHWETPAPQVTAMAQPRTIYDFYGFPQALYEVTYPAPGSPTLARLVQEAVKDSHVQLDQAWGLDHGAWSVLARIFPSAHIPVVQLGLDRHLSPEAHYALGRQLRPLRRKGVMIIGSGNIVHNLRQIQWADTAYDWALEFDEAIRQRIAAGDPRRSSTTDGWGRRLACPSLPMSISSRCSTRWRCKKVMTMSSSSPTK